MSRITWKNGVRNTHTYTADEIAAMRAEREMAEAAERRRPLTEAEVAGMLIRAQINTLDVDDQTALRMTGYYPEWAPAQTYTAGYRVQYGGKLYRIVTAHTSQADWTPDTAVTLYTRIDEQHDGSRYDPIPYDGNMALTAGMYYVQEDAVYLCTRSTGNPVYNALAELAGIYVEEVADA